MSKPEEQLDLYTEIANKYGIPRDVVKQLAVGVSYDFRPNPNRRGNLKEELDRVVGLLLGIGEAKGTKDDAIL